MTQMPRLRFLLIESESPEDRAARRESAGKSAGETFAATLRQMFDATTDHVAPADAADRPLTSDEIAAYDAVFLSGSPLHVWCDTPEVRRHLDFMRAVFASGTPAFGSCAGLQIAVAAAGGTVRAMPHRQEVGIARGIVATEAGRGHPLLAGRRAVWDALAIHGDEVEALPAGATLLAANAAARVQAAEVRCGEGMFWGVQYHPELAPEEIAAALRRQADGLVDDGVVDHTDAVEAQAKLFDRLHDAPDHRETRWHLGIDDQVAVEENRRIEIANFVEHLVLPTRVRRRMAVTA